MEMPPEYVCVMPSVLNWLPSILSTLSVSGLYTYSVFLKNQFCPYDTEGLKFRYFSNVKEGSPMAKLCVMPFWKRLRKPSSPNSEALKLILFCSEVLYPKDILSYAFSLPTLFFCLNG